MHVQFLQHVPFEGPAGIETWFREQVLELLVTRLFKTTSIPDPRQNDLTSGSFVRFFVDLSRLTP